MSELVDMRSDTVTKPTIVMRKAMSEAVVGDDVYKEDPTIIALEQRIASIFQKVAALFFPSGTMSNLTAILCWCNSRGSEMIVSDNSHMFLFEQAGAAQFGGVSPRTVPNLPANSQTK
jgi:threonine aldolase